VLNQFLLLHALGFTLYARPTPLHTIRRIQLSFDEIILKPLEGEIARPGNRQSRRYQHNAFYFYKLHANSGRLIMALNACLKPNTAGSHY
jgi:hypothetical protein